MDYTSGHTIFVALGQLDDQPVSSSTVGDRAEPGFYVIDRTWD